AGTDDVIAENSVGLQRAPDEVFLAGAQIDDVVAYLAGQVEMAAVEAPDHIGVENVVVEGCEFGSTSIVLPEPALPLRLDALDLFVGGIGRGRVEHGRIAVDTV